MGGLKKGVTSAKEVERFYPGGNWLLHGLVDDPLRHKHQRPLCSKWNPCRLRRQVSFLSSYRTNNNDHCSHRLCGMVFNSAQTSAGSPNVPVYSFSKPFSIYVHTDSLEGSSSPPESLNRGFCLNYVQQPCTSSSG